MNNTQRRSKNVGPLVSIHTIESQPNTTPMVDPRSPSANITRLETKSSSSFD